ncbi:MAG: class I adenylate cyclase [Pseudomonadota bacterium]
MSAAADDIRNPNAPGRLKEVRKRFEFVNRERLGRVRHALPAKQKSIFDLLPLLIHTNHPLLPGYVGKEAPCGIANYTPDDVALRAANRLARSFEYRRRAALSVDIHAMFLMGSSGTIAYSRQSDFDVWVCHRPDLSDADIETLAAKTDGISTWADSLGLEVNFFVMSAKDFQAGRNKVLSAESSGSAQHYLLLDEFYRTSLLLAGRFPAWWLVPPEQEENYRAYLASVAKRREVSDDEWVDFGPVNQIPAAEFFGATLWQLSKAIASPHKSLLKIILLEAYALEYPNIDLLSVRYKRAIWGSERSLTNLDPYVIFMRKVEDHLDAVGDQRRRQLARRSFYLKVNLPMSVRKSAADDWRRDVMDEYIEQWKWPTDLVQQLDQRSQWRIDQILEERNAIVNALVHSYKALTRFGRRHAEEANVSDHDLTILGRKLYAAFERKGGKIELVTQGIEHRLEEEELTLTYDAKLDSWHLQRGLVNTLTNNIIRSGTTAFELVAWCYFNGVADRTSRFHVLGEGRRQLEQDAYRVRGVLEQRYPGAVPRIVDVEIYARPPTTESALLFVNVGVDPQESFTKKGMHLTSNQGDALNYGGLQDNLVKAVDYLLMNSWGEVLTFHYQDVAGLLECLCEHVNRCRQAGQPPPRIECHALSSDYAQAIQRRVQELSDELLDWAATKPNGSLFIVKSGANHHALQRTEAGLWLAFSGNYAEFIAFLGRTESDQRLDLTFDKRIAPESAIATVYKASQESQITVCYQLNGKQADLYITDEKGALFFDRIEFDSEAILIRNLSEFFESVHFRQASDSFNIMPPAVRFFELVRHGGAYRLRSANDEFQERLNPSAAVQVIAQLTPDGETVFSLFCEDEEFSSREYGEGVFEALAQHILNRRAGRAPYPIHITDLDLSRLSKNASRLQTVHYLMYRRRFEERVNQYITGG